MEHYTVMKNEKDLHELIQSNVKDILSSDKK